MNVVFWECLILWQKNQSRESKLTKADKQLKIDMLGHKRISSREGGIEKVVKELTTRMAAFGYDVICYNRKGHHVSGQEFDINLNNDIFKGVEIIWM